MRKRKILAILIIVFVSISPALAGDDEGDENRLAMFSISLLSPNTLEARNQWAVLMQKQLPKIGIDVYLHESTGWGNIDPRTWNYPLIDFDYIPTYAEGGYDILFVGWNWEMDFNPTGHYDTGCWISSENYYQYSNPFYDGKLNDYLTSYNPDERDQFAYELQAILYEDLPAISILYESSLFLIDNGISGIVPLLHKVRCDHSENWNNSLSTDLIYCNKNELNSYNAFQLEKENFAISNQNFDHLWAQCVYGSLYKRNLLDYRWEPSIAKNATIIPHYYDSKYIRNVSIFVDIDPEAKFSNGDPVLAEDIKYSYDLHFSTSAHSTYGNLLTKYFSSNDSIVVIDSDTVRFDFRYMYNFPFSLLSYSLIDKSTVEPIVSIYGYEVLKEAPFSVNASDSLVTSCGPFKLDSYNVTENKIVLTKNEYWFGSAQKLNNITFLSVPNRDEAFSMLVEGEVDILDVTYDYLYSEVVNPPDFELSYKVILCDSLSHQEMGINMRHPMIGTGELTPVGTADAGKYLRKAISHIIPRQKIIDECLEGLGIPGVTPIPHGCVGFDESLDPYAYALELAIEYTEKAGFILCPPLSTSTILLLPFLVSLVYISILKWKKR